MGGKRQTAIVASGFGTRCISGKSLAKGSRGKGITPNNSTLSMLAVSKPVFKASLWTIVTLFKFAFFNFLETTWISKARVTFK